MVFEFVIASILGSLVVASTPLWPDGLKLAPVAIAVSLYGALGAYSLFVDGPRRRASEARRKACRVPVPATVVSCRYAGVMSHSRLKYYALQVTYQTPGGPQGTATVQVHIPEGFEDEVAVGRTLDAVYEPVPVDEREERFGREFLLLVRVCDQWYSNNLTD